MDIHPKKNRSCKKDSASIVILIEPIGVFTDYTVCVRDLSTRVKPLTYLSSSEYCTTNHACHLSHQHICVISANPMICVTLCTKYSFIVHFLLDHMYVVVTCNVNFNYPFVFIHLT